MTPRMLREMHLFQADLSHSKEREAGTIAASKTSLYLAWCIPVSPFKTILPFTEAKNSLKKQNLMETLASAGYCSFYVSHVLLDLSWSSWPTLSWILLGSKWTGSLTGRIMSVQARQASLNSYVKPTLSACSKLPLNYCLPPLTTCGSNFFSASSSTSSFPGWA